MLIHAGVGGCLVCNHAYDDHGKSGCVAKEDIPQGRAVCPCSLPYGGMT